ncbi:MAG: hypothetical protein OEY24_02215 [Candidatus Bathyarchaeota archaeon]|nr:hypothetical protein [Candidatus Bathyarchaeota archaeon]MDH5494504.1 hypothetical protein [Candidatus Bathyarchaeota archaeon]
MVRYSRYSGKISNPVLAAAALLIFLSLLLQSVLGTAYYSLAMNAYASVSSPPVILQNGTAGTCTIYANNTSAKVNVANTTYDYVLRVNNTIADSWQIRLKKYADSNINRLQNCTIYFHNSTDGTSSQVHIENGAYTQDTGTWYNLPSLATIYIAITVVTNSTGTSHVHSYLEILTPNTSTYAQYVIAFEIT